MAITYDYKIDSAFTIKNDQYSGLNDIIDTLRFTITATDENGRTESVKSEIGLLSKVVVGTDADGQDIYEFDLDGNNFTPLSEITQEQMKNWLLETITTQDQNGNPHNGMEAMLAKRFVDVESPFAEVTFE